MTPRSKLDNPDIVPLALFELGGAGEFIDVEDIFFKCYELAPERFGWRTRPLPNYKTLSKALRDLEGDHPSLLVKTPDGLRRQLSAEGVEWVRGRMQEFRKTMTTPGLNPPTRRPSQRLLNSLRDTPLVQAFVRGERPVLKRYEVADLLVCSPDSPKSLWLERLETFRSAAADANRHELMDFLEFVRKSEPQWFEGSK